MIKVVNRVVVQGGKTFLAYLIIIIMVYTVVYVRAVVQLVEQCGVVRGRQLRIVIDVLLRTVEGTGTVMRARRIVRKGRETLGLLRYFI